MILAQSDFFLYMYSVQNFIMSNINWLSENRSYWNFTLKLHVEALMTRQRRNVADRIRNFLHANPQLIELNSYELVQRILANFINDWEFIHEWWLGPNNRPTIYGMEYGVRIRQISEAKVIREQLKYLGFSDNISRIASLCIYLGFVFKEGRLEGRCAVNIFAI